MIIERVSDFGQELFSCEGDGEQDDHLVDGLSHDVFEHVAVDHVLVFGVRRSIEQFGSGRLRGQSQRGQTVHDQVYPQHLDRAHYLLLQNQSPDQGRQDGHQIHSQLKLQKLLYIVVDVPAPRHRLHDATEVVVQQYDVARILSHLSSSNAHRKTHVRLFQSRRVVCAVSGHSHHVSSLHQSSHHRIFVFRSTSSQHLKSPN